MHCYEVKLNRTKKYHYFSEEDGIKFAVFVQLYSREWMGYLWSSSILNIKLAEKALRSKCKVLGLLSESIIVVQVKKVGKPTPGSIQVNKFEYDHERMRYVRKGKIKRYKGIQPTLNSRKKIAFDDTVYQGSKIDIVNYRLLP